MHCEKCGSADTEVVKCSKCGQKSRIKCANCSFSSCTDKYCEVISIKRKIKILTYFAVALIVLMVFVLPVIIMRAIEEDGPTPPTRIVRPPVTRPATPATEPATGLATEPATPNEATEPPLDPVPDDGGFDEDPFGEPEDVGEPEADVETQRKSVLAEARKLIARRLPYKSGATDPSEGGIGYKEFVVYVFGQAGVEVPLSLRGMAGLGEKVPSIDQLEIGDIIFFSIKRNNKANFVGISLGDGKVAFVYPKKTAMEVPLSHKFWEPRFLYGIRVLGE